MTSNPPAAMPSEEEIKRVLFEFATCTDIAKGPAALDANAGPFARAILALFAPILAEKERLEDELEGTDWHAVEAGRQRDVWKARALAAEAALAAAKAEERERAANKVAVHSNLRLVRVKVNGKIVEDGGEEWFASQREVEQMVRTIAAAIRAQGE